MIDAAVLEGGLERVAEIAAAGAGGAVAIVIPGSGATFAPAQAERACDLQALAHLASERVRGRPAAVPPNVVAEAPVMLRGESMGIVALLRNGTAAREGATEFIERAASATMVALAIEDARREAELALRGSLIEALRNGEELGPREIARRAARLGCDLSGGAAVVAVEVTGGRPEWVAATIAQEHPLALVQRYAEPGPGRPDRVYAVLPGREAGGPETLATAERLAARLRPYGIVAASSFYSDPGQLSVAVRESDLVLAALLGCGRAGERGLLGGTYRLLFRTLAAHPDGLVDFYESSLAPLADYDARYGTDLVPTLDAYLEKNCNMNATARAMFAHRHTIAHRLERIRKLTGLDPTCTEDRERLGLALKVARLVARRPAD
jgi:hypothetical protein